MLIIIEGADKTGKTTLAKAIAKRFNYQYHHFGPPKGHPADEYIDFLLNLRQPTVCDRFHLGELVYGPMFRGKAGITPLELVTIERMMRLKQTIVIHVVTDMKLASERLANSAEHEIVDIWQNIAAANGFAEVIPETNTGVVLQYDGSTRRNVRRMIDRLDDIIHDRNPIPSTFAGYTGIGTVAGQKLVFVGEQVNKNVTWRNLPFDRGAASQFLLDMFTKANVPEQMVYVCNADKLTFSEMWALTMTGKTTFITLGKKATDKLTGFGVTHFEFAHPQFIKRFHYKQKDKYAEQLKKIVACA